MEGDRVKGETINLHPDLRTILLTLEARLGFEVSVTSGYRHPDHNEDVGGVPDSEHTYSPAEGADILCLRSSTRYRMLRELFAMNIRRIGIGQTFLHVGLATDKPQDCAWTYYPTVKKTPPTV